MCTSIIVIVLCIHFLALIQVYSPLIGNSMDSVHSDASMKEDAQSSYHPVKQGYGLIIFAIHMCDG